MKRLIVLTLFIMSGLGLLSAIAQHTQPPNWKGKVETRDGLETVVNPQAPLYGRLELELQEDLRIGLEGDKNAQFWFVNGVQVDDDANIYVSDAKNFRIQVFDRNGRYLRTLGRQGQGPGEFQQISLLRINSPLGRLYVRDIPARKIVILDLEGKYLGSVPTKDVVLNFYPLDDGGFVAAVSVFSEADLKTTHDLIKMNAKGEVISRQGGFLSNPFTERSSMGIMGVHTGFELEVRLAQLDADRFAYGFSERYEWTIVDKDMKPLRHFVKEGRPPTFTEEEKSGFKRIPLPKAKPFFFNAISDCKGRIYVQKNFTKNKSTVQDDIPMEVDVFSPEGYFIYTTTLPPNTHVIRDGLLYAYHVNFDKGLETVVRYRVKNWDRIK